LLSPESLSPLFAHKTVRGGLFQGGGTNGRRWKMSGCGKQGLHFGLAQGPSVIGQGFVEWAGYKTWFTSFGRCAAGRLPLLVAHGGPGMTHDYLLPLQALASSGRQVVLYDQLGNGNSTHLPGKESDEEFWTPALYLAELDEVIKHLGFSSGMHFLGQSWGGMLGIEYAVRRPKELASLILADSPSSMSTWAVELGKLREGLPDDIRQVLDACEEAGATDTPEYVEATLAFYRRHLCRLDPWPEGMQKTYDLAVQFPTVYGTMIGASEFNVTGSLSSWDMDDRLPEISVPTLVLHGEFDEATDEVVRASRELIPDVEYRKIPGASHTPHLENPELTMPIIADFLARHDLPL
jgi:L-proline amide hydrolase